MILVECMMLMKGEDNDIGGVDDVDGGNSW